SLQEWAGADGVRRAGISSFGFGGTNCHMIVEGAPARELHEGERGSGTEAGEPEARLLAISARSEAALSELEFRYRELLSSGNRPPLASVCYTAATGRDTFALRTAVVADSAEELADKLSSGLAYRGSAPEDGDRKTAFLFTGQGAQYPGMARELYRKEAAFREAFDRCGAALGNIKGRSLREWMLEGDVASLKATSLTQPLTFAVDYALARMWMSWGLRPAAVLGHSVGEYAAACIAGVISPEEGVRLTAARGRLMEEECEPGAMAAILAGEEQVRAYIRRSCTEAERERIAIGAVNGRSNTVVSGEEALVERVIQEAEREGTGVHRLSVSHAFHSPLMKPMLKAYEEELKRVEFREPELALISNVTGRVQEEKLGPGYWLEHILSPVRFAESVET
ncbi:acyltransferase domain-containing protein, partial [Paenibacillus sp. TH7-28]